MLVTLEGFDGLQLAILKMCVQEGRFYWSVGRVWYEAPVVDDAVTVRLRPQPHASHVEAHPSPTLKGN